MGEISFPKPSKYGIGVISGSRISLIVYGENHQQCSYLMGGIAGISYRNRDTI